jgi:2,4-dienoyl-CoA reductase-like NADH-dependent reductase (Old Yellow Enzyme family)
MTPWHLSQIGGWVTRGPGLAIIEGTAVSENGRINPNGAGLWKDEQIPSLKTVVDFTHSQGQLIGIELFHAGRTMARKS